MSMFLDRETMANPYYKVEFNGRELATNLKRYITLIEFEESDEEANLARITVNDPEFDFLNATNLTKKMKVKLWMGYEKKNRLMLDGEVSHLEADLADSGMPTLVIGCIDTSNAMTYTKKSRKWTNKSATDIVRSIASEYGYSSVIPSSTSPIEEVVQEEETDAQILRRLADDEGFQFYINSENKTLYFGSRFNDTAIKDYLYYNAKDSSIRNFRPSFVEKSKPENVKSKEGNVSTSDGSTVTTNSSASGGSGGSGGSSSGGDIGISPVTGAVRR